MTIDRRRVELVFLSLFGAVVAAVFVATERGFPHWDMAAYHERTLATADAFRGSPSDGFEFIRRSLHGDYNVLFTLPLLPWSVFVGESRVVFILSLYVTYFLPFLCAVAEIAGRCLPGAPDYARRVAAVAVLLTPFSWYHVAEGYPDIGGAALLAICVLIFGRRAIANSLWPSALLIAVLAAAAIAFRRPYVFGVAALFGAMLIDDTWQLFRRKADVARSSAFARLASTFCSAAVAVLLVTVAAPGVVQRALHRGDQFLAYEMTVGDTFEMLVGSVGLMAVILAAVGWMWLARFGHIRRAELRLILLATALWVVLWAAVSRHPPYHYPHWLPIAVVLGATGLWVMAGNLPGSVWRRSVRGGTVMAGILGWAFCVPVPDLGFTRQTPLRLFPDPVQQNNSPAYESIVALTGYLREVAGPNDPVLVAASSVTLNRFTLQSAEHKLFGRRNSFLWILFPADVDGDQVVPTYSLLSAALVVVAEPYQLHLHPEHQKSVRVLVDAFIENWPISRDFVQLPREFPLPGGRVRIFRRHRPTSFEDALDASRRVDAFVLGRTNQDGVWITDSPYPSDVSRTGDGSVRITIHPTLGSSSRQSFARLAVPPSDSLRLSGMVEFFDARCAGVEIGSIAGTDGSRPVSRLLLATPNSGRAAFDTVVRLDGEPLNLVVRSHPASPERIDYCTVVINELRAR